MNTKSTLPILVLVALTMPFAFVASLYILTKNRFGLIFNSERRKALVGNPWLL